jgi:hypothetical protein
VPKKRQYPSTLCANRRRVARYLAEDLCVTCGLDVGAVTTVRCEICKDKARVNLLARRAQMKAAA